MAGHTPGPWSVAYHDGNDQAVVSGQHTEIATCWHHCVVELETQMQANARLISAAPDMLEALDYRGVPVFAKRDNARAWKRSQRNPISSPVGSGAPAVPAMPTASPSGIGDGADTAAGEADLLDFIGVRP